MFEIVRSARLRALEVRAAVADNTAAAEKQRADYAMRALEQEKKETKRLLDKIILMKQAGYTSGHGDGEQPGWGKYSMEEVEQEQLRTTRQRPPAIVRGDDPELQAFEAEFRNIDLTPDDE